MFVQWFRSGQEHSYFVRGVRWRGSCKSECEYRCECGRGRGSESESESASSVGRGAEARVKVGAEATLLHYVFRYPQIKRHFPPPTSQVHLRGQFWFRVVRTGLTASFLDLEAFGRTVVLHDFIECLVTAQGTVANHLIALKRESLIEVHQMCFVPVTTF